MTKDNPEWKKLELVVAELQKQLSPNAQVRHDHRITGRSGRRRKLDVTVTQTVGTYPVLIVFDCKKHKGPVKMKHVESFVGQVEDVRANLGVMISDTGFDAGARAIAAQKNIILRVIRKAAKTDWNKIVGESAWLFLMRVEISQVNTTAILSNHHSAVEVPFNVLLFDDKAEVVGNIRDFFWEAWDAPESPHALGKVEVRIDTPGVPCFILSQGNYIQAEEFVIQAEVVAKKYAISLQLAGGNILEDAESKETIYHDLASEGFDWAVLLNKQSGIEISQEEYENSRKQQQFMIDLSKAKKYLRVSFKTSKESGAKQ